MNEKLTLKLDAQTIESAKAFAKAHQTSLSKLVEAYFRKLEPHQSTKKPHLNGVVKELAGVLKDVDLKGFREEYTEHLEEKYS